MDTIAQNNMKLLIINQKMDETDAVLGIYVNWINEFANQCEHVHVITQHKGKANVNKNVTIHSLGKEKKASKPTQVLRFYKLLNKLLPEVDAAVVHMIPLWVILGGPLYKLHKTPVFLFYAHKHTDAKLKLAARISAGVFSSTPGSITLQSPKITLVGQGIPVSKLMFKNKDRGLPKTIKMITIGRLTPRKDYLTILDACTQLNNQDIPFTLNIIGPAITQEEQDYHQDIKQYIKKNKLQKQVTLAGSVPHNAIHNAYHSADILINAASTTGADKVVFEAAATGCIPIACDPALIQFLDNKRITFNPGNAAQLAQAILAVKTMTPTKRNELRNTLHEQVKEHTSPRQIKRILNTIKKKLK